MTPNEILFLIGAAVFAITGVLAAARQNMDVMSFVVIGVVTAIGGGTLRDVILGLRPFWLEQPAYLYVTSGAAIATFFFERRFRAGYKALLYLDALVTAVFTIIATERTLQLGLEPGVAVLMGVIAGIGGGVLRDLLTGQPTVLMRRELYMTPIIIGGALYVVVRHNAGLAPLHVSLLGIAAITIVRLAAIRWSWAFPDWLTYRPLK
ncbi:MAG: trimeric intracellular cation channel family protein [Gammaproteobacteria bacterium]